MWLGLSVLIFKPWKAAFFLFFPTPPKWEVPDNIISKMSSVRSYAGVIGIIILSIGYINAAQVWDSLLSAALQTIELGALMVILSVGLWRMASLKNISIKTVPLLPASFLRAIGLMASVQLAYFLLRLLSRKFLDPTDPPLVGILISAIVGLWLTAFFIGVFTALIFWSFGADEAHPMLAPICTLLTTVAVYVVNVTGLSGGSVSFPTQWIINLSALASTAGLCIAELVWLYRIGIGILRLPPAVNAYDEEPTQLTTWLATGEGIQGPHGRGYRPPVHARTSSSFAVIRVSILAVVMVAGLSDYIFLEGQRAPYSGPAVVNDLPPGNYKAFWDGQEADASQWQQQIHLTSKAPDMSWALGWNWPYSTQSNYLSLTTDGVRADRTRGDEILLLLPGATKYIGSNCHAWKKGVGVICNPPFSLGTNKTYLLGLYNLGRVRGASGFWWRIAVGAITGNSAYTQMSIIANVSFPSSVEPTDFNDWISYLPATESFTECSQIPQSLASFGPLFDFSEFPKNANPKFHSMNISRVEASSCPRETPIFTPTSAKYPTGQ